MKQFKHFLINERRFEADNIISVLKQRFYMKDGRSVYLDTSEDFITYLKENYKINRIGSGSYSIAVISGNTNNPKYVLKYNSNSFNDKWFDYADYLIKHNLNTGLFPKILYAGFPFYNNADIGIGIMEYLNTDEKYINSILKKYKEDIITPYIDKVDIDIQEIKKFKTITNILKNKNINITDKDKQIMVTNIEINNIHTFKNLINNLYFGDFYNLFNKLRDIHNEQIMRQRYMTISSENQIKYKPVFLSLKDGIFKTHLDLFKKSAEFFGVSNKQFRKFFKVINKITKSDDSLYDIHNGNIGFRKNGQLVIFDPIGN